MKKIRKIFAVLLVSTMVFGGAGVDICSAYHDKDGKSGHDHGDEVYKKARIILSNKAELGLTDEQAAKVKDLSSKVKKDLIRKDAEIDIGAIDLKEEKWKDPVDIEAVNKLIDKKYELKKDKAKYQVAAYAELQGLLTADQKIKVKEIYKKCDKKK